MVAFTRGCRQESPRPLAVRTPIDALLADFDDRLEDPYRAAASHRAVRNVVVRTEADGTIAGIRIGRWRVISPGAGRRLAEVRQLSCGRVAVRVERLADDGVTPCSEIWQLYDREGRLHAALQTTPDGRFAILTNYQTRTARRLAADSRGELRAVETWAI